MQCCLGCLGCAVLSGVERSQHGPPAVGYMESTEGGVYVSFQRHVVAQAAISPPRKTFIDVGEALAAKLSVHK